MSDWTDTWWGRAGILTLIVVAMAGLAIVILRANVDETVSVMAAVGGVFGGVGSLLVLWDRIRSQSTAEESTRSPPSRQPPIEFPGSGGEDRSAGPGGAGPKSKEERAQEIEDSLDWRSAGTRNYRNTPVRLARALASGFARLPISERWSRRVAFALAALSYLWVLLIFGRSFNEIVPGYTPEAVLPIIYALPIPTIWGTSAFTPTELVSLLVPVFVVMVVVLGGDLKRRSTCEECDEPWALENEGTHYHRDSKTPKSRRSTARNTPGTNTRASSYCAVSMTTAVNTTSRRPSGTIGRSGSS